MCASTTCCAMSKDCAFVQESLLEPATHDTLKSRMKSGGQVCILLFIGVYHAQMFLGV